MSQIDQPVENVESANLVWISQNGELVIRSQIAKAVYKSENVNLVQMCKNV